MGFQSQGLQFQVESLAYFRKQPRFMIQVDTEVGEGQSSRPSGLEENYQNTGLDENKLDYWKEGRNPTDLH